MVVADAVGDLEVVRWVQRDAFVALRDGDGPDDLQIFAWHGQLLHAGFLDEVNERRGATVHDRHFGRIQLNQDVVDVHADERGEEVLDGLDGDFVVRQPGCELDARQMVHGRRHVMVA